MAQENKGKTPQEQAAQPQNRGANLRKDMVDSAEYGNQYRSEHFGSDTFDGQVNKDTPSPADSSKK